MCLIHHQRVGHRRPRVVERRLHLGTKPRIIDFRIGRKAGGKRAFLDKAGQQDANRVRDGQAEIGERFRRLCLEMVINADVQRRGMRVNVPQADSKRLFIAGWPSLRTAEPSEPDAYPGVE